MPSLSLYQRFRHVIAIPYILFYSPPFTQESICDSDIGYWFLRIIVGFIEKLLNIMRLVLIFALISSAYSQSCPPGGVLDVQHQM